MKTVRKLCAKGNYVQYDQSNYVQWDYGNYVQYVQNE